MACLQTRFVNDLQQKVLFKKAIDSFSDHVVKMEANTICLYGKVKGLPGERYVMLKEFVQLKRLTKYPF